MKFADALHESAYLQALLGIWTPKPPRVQMNKYAPHQGDRERARRKRQLAAGQLTGLGAKPGRHPFHRTNQESDDAQSR